MDASYRVKDKFEESVQVLTEAANQLALPIVIAAETTSDALLNNCKILTCGNGASAIAAQHFTTIMLNRFATERPALPAHALMTDSSTLTSIADDDQFADIFSKQIRALGQSGDILLAVSHKPNSHNIIHAIDAAHDRNMRIVALTGQDGGRITELLLEQDIEIRAPSWISAYIQEVHLTVIHAICDLIDRRLLGQEE